MSILKRLLHLQIVIGHCVATLSSHDHIKPAFCGMAQLSSAWWVEYKVYFLFKGFSGLELWFLEEVYDTKKLSMKEICYGVKGGYPKV